METGTRRPAASDRVSQRPTASHDAAPARARDVLERARNRATASRERWGSTADVSRQMSALSQCFHSLRGANGTEPWDPERLMRWACAGRSHGEVLAARFVLSVWNSGTDWAEEAKAEGIDNSAALARFDLFEALQTWDYDHQDAFLKWVEAPFWP